ncbi:transglycosylase SLT domain-containing protein [Melioribacteraceae bacterium 4301-Me]|uniref:transglycosylase SLT domain-containing protein n=1 Tax=Pyranulibacter aquaticus TaxID=3163344 RepID=UPI003594E782
MKTLELTTTNPLKHLQSNAISQNSLSDEKRIKIAKAAREFESLLTSLMVKSMTQSTGGLFGDSGFGGDDFDTIFESKLSSYISENKSLGIAEILYEKITGEPFDPSIFYKKPPIINEIKSNIKNNATESSFNYLTPSYEAMQRLENYSAIIIKAAKQYNIDEDLIKSVILAESSAKHNAVSPAGAKGLMQLMDSTSTQLGVRNVFNPEENILAGAKYLSSLLKDYNGNLELSLAAYNAGPNNVSKYNGVPPFEETANYIQRVKGYLKYFKG